MFLKATFFLTLMLVSIVAVPCTTFFLNGSKTSIVAKNMDWAYGQGLALINKRHIQKRAIFVNPQNALSWTSKYMSLTFTETGREFPWEGMNEAGVAVTIMMLDHTVLPSPTVLKPAVNGLQWIQFILDTSSSVNEAINNAQKIKIEGHMAAQQHYMVCDRHSDCATFEYVDGQLVVHTDGQLPYKALTNNTYDDSLTYLKTLLLRSSPSAILSGHAFGSLDRFARAALFTKGYLPPPLNATPTINNDDGELRYAFKALDNVSEPVGTRWPTQWSFTLSLVPRLVHFRTLQSREIKFVRLLQFDPSCKSGSKMFNMNAQARGDVTSSFINYSSEVNRRLLAVSRDIEPQAKVYIEKYVDANTRCLE